ncbi:22991_t:CDS:2, partial [Racocetra persica]
NENTEEIYALKVFENSTLISKEIENELENLLSVESHQNIIKFYGVTKFEDRMDEDKIKYAFVLECADGGTLRDYLTKNTSNIEWELKIQFAIQLVGLSVPSTIKNYISDNGETEDNILNWLYLNKNEPKYICLRGIFYMWGIGTKEGKESSIKVLDLFLDAANRNDVVAQYFAGRCYEVGWDTKKNMREAIKWYNKATKNGCAAAERILGDYCYKCQEYSKAFTLLKSAVDNGNIMAMHNLGLCYKFGHGVKIDTFQGFTLLKQAADKGVPNSSYELARCYEFGKGTVENFREALNWYQKATDDGKNCHDERERVMVKIRMEQSR